MNIFTTCNNLELINKPIQISDNPWIPVNIVTIEGISNRCILYIKKSMYTETYQTLLGASIISVLKIMSSYSDIYNLDLIGYLTGYTDYYNLKVEVSDKDKTRLNLIIYIENGMINCVTKC